MRESGSNRYKIVRFYGDWIVHTEKKVITPEIKEIMDRIDHEIPANHNENMVWRLHQKEAIGFIYMESLKKELKELFKEEDINPIILEEPTWTGFVSILVKILEDQPILNPNDSIKLFSFVPSADRCAIWTIQFNDSRGLMNFGNKY